VRLLSKPYILKESLRNKKFVLKWPFSNDVLEHSKIVGERAIFNVYFGGILFV
jgi:hypothetical protein